ncbi:MAG: ABC transporter permease, partial [Acidimicrobiales bacterium]
AADMAQGVVDRFRVVPMARSAVLAGHTVAGVARATIGMVVMVGVGLAVGFRPSAGVGAWALAIGVTLLVTFSLSWVAAVLGLLARSVEAVQQVAMVLIIPIFASSAFVPTSTMPGWVQVVAVNQPMTQAIDAVRAELLGLPVGDHLGLALAWFGAILVGAFGAAGYLFSRRANV